MAFSEEIACNFVDFGVSATVGVASVRGIFDAAYQDVLGIVAGSSPTLTCATSDVTAAAVGTTVVVNSITYTVAEIQPDGTGVTRLLLKS